MSKHNHANQARAEESAEEIKKDVPVSASGAEGAAKKDSPPVKGEKDDETPDAGANKVNKADSSSVEAGAEQKIAELEAKLAELNDQFLRKAADFENFRKRTIREKQELADFSNQNLLLDLLPVIDDFERAIKSAESSKDFNGFYEGITLIEKRLSTQLENKWGLRRFDSAGEPFDPNRHEAIQMEKAEGVTEAVVQDDFVKGYLLKDRVIRFAKVKVLMPKEEGPAIKNEEQETGK